MNRSETNLAKKLKKYTKYVNAKLDKHSLKTILEDQGFDKKQIKEIINNFDFKNDFLIGDGLDMAEGLKNQLLTVDVNQDLNSLLNEEVSSVKLFKSLKEGSDGHMLNRFAALFTRMKGMAHANDLTKEELDMYGKLSEYLEEFTNFIGAQRFENHITRKNYNETMDKINLHKKELVSICEKMGFTYDFDDIKVLFDRRYGLHQQQISIGQKSSTQYNYDNLKKGEGNIDYNIDKGNY